MKAFIDTLSRLILFMCVVCSDFLSTAVRGRPSDCAHTASTLPPQCAGTSSSTCTGLKTACSRALAQLSDMTGLEKMLCTVHSDPSASCACLHAAAGS